MINLYDRSNVGMDDAMGCTRFIPSIYTHCIPIIFLLLSHMVVANSYGLDTH